MIKVFQYISKQYHHIFKELHHIIKIFHHIFNIFHHIFKLYLHIFKQFPNIFKSYQHIISKIIFNKEETALHIACEKGHFEIVELLISQTNLDINLLKEIYS